MTYEAVKSQDKYGTNFIYSENRRKYPRQYKVNCSAIFAEENMLRNKTESRAIIESTSELSPTLSKSKTGNIRSAIFVYL